MRHPVLKDIQRNEPHFDPRVIFDVGANVGQSALEFRELFPFALLYCFEPVAATVRALREALPEDGLTVIHHGALGAEEGRALVTARRTSSGNKMIVNPRNMDNIEEVPVTTGEAFCREEGLERIDFLKIDTEGFDLKVLQGFEPLLRKGQVAYVQAECGFHRENRLHVPFEALLAYMKGVGYGLYGLYGTSRKDVFGDRVSRGLFYGNAAFVREG